MRSCCQSLLSALVVCQVLGADLEAQAPAPTTTVRRALIGFVRDSGGSAIPGVTVTVPGATSLSDTRGRFEVFTADFDTVTISFRRLGFDPIDARLRSMKRTWDTVLVQLDASAERLAPVTVNDERSRSTLGLRGFEERRARGIGQFITRADIVARGSYRLSDVLRTKRGVNVVRGGKVRFVAFTGGRSTLCQPTIWLDGIRSLAMELDELLPNTVEAMELYTSLSTLPIEFQPVGANTTPCGTIVVWSRIPNGSSR